MTLRPRNDIGGGPPLGVNVGVASQIVVRDNQYRRKVTLVNDSANIIYVAKSDFAVLNAGVRLNANGGAIVDEPDQTGYIYTGPWSAICAVATQRLCIQEN
jgi:hypothetical protein